MHPNGIEAAASYLLERRRTRMPIDKLPAGSEPVDEAEAYAVQQRLHRSTGPVCGYKIGCTTPVMQEYLGIRQPCAGGIRCAEVFGPDAERPAADFLRPGVECEIAARLGRDLPADRAPYTRQTVEAAVEAVMAAIEIVDDRYEDWQSRSAASLIADDFFNAGCVLADPVTAWAKLDLAGVRGRMAINGAEIGAGVGADVLGHPLEALAWFANLRGSLGLGLRAGTFVLLGSVVQTHWVQQGDLVEIGIDGLGRASLRLV